jgi:hypothetical protein
LRRNCRRPNAQPLNDVGHRASRALMAAASSRKNSHTITSIWLRIGSPQSRRACQPRPCVISRSRRRPRADVWHPTLV